MGHTDKAKLNCLILLILYKNIFSSSRFLLILWNPLLSIYRCVQYFRIDRSRKVFLPKASRNQQSPKLRCCFDFGKRPTVVHPLAISSDGSRDRKVSVKCRRFAPAVHRRRHQAPSATESERRSENRNPKSGGEPQRETHAAGCDDEPRVECVWMAERTLARTRWHWQADDSKQAKLSCSGPSVLGLPVVLERTDVWPK